ncbi:PTI1-like tyrosine-protein kinase, partial [Tanacetum coccineum]
MFCDNSAALHFANEPGVQRGAKHYHMRYHYVRESITLGEIRFLKVHTDDNLVDPFMKALPKGKLTQHTRSIGLRLASSFMKEKGTNEATWRKFSLKELHAATNNFNYDNKLGEGGFGSCYWGQLWDRSQIAVKRLKVWRNKAEMEFAVEVEILARVRHKNLLSLRGYCAEGQERLIVYDYMANLSLLSHLRGQHESLLDWSRRMTIAIGSAEGIAV